MYITTQISDKEKCFWHRKWVLWYNPDHLNLHYTFTEFYNGSGKSVEAEGCSARQTSTTLINMVSPHEATWQQPALEEANNSWGQWGQRHSKYWNRIITQNLQLQQLLYSKKHSKILSHWWKSNGDVFREAKRQRSGMFCSGHFPHTEHAQCSILY